jgi:hypothetical protein
MIRQQIESGFDDITQIDPEIRGIVERNGRICWPSFRPTNDRYSTRGGSSALQDGPEEKN